MIHLLRRIYWHNFLGQKIASGPVAQLGAHHIRIVGVVGSNPIRSTKKSREI